MYIYIYLSTYGYEVSTLTNGMIFHQRIGYPRENLQEKPLFESSRVFLPNIGLRYWFWILIVNHHTWRYDIELSIFFGDIPCSIVHIHPYPKLCCWKNTEH